jgi:hypothetical protein
MPRKNAMSSVTVPISHLAWDYIVEKFGMPVHHMDKIYTESTIHSNDLAVMKVKSWVACRVVHVKDKDAVLKTISLFGISSTVSVRKQFPAIAKKLTTDEPNVMSRGVFLERDCINFADVLDHVIVNPR